MDITESSANPLAQIATKQIDVVSNTENCLKALINGPSTLPQEVHEQIFQISLSQLKQETLNWQERMKNQETQLAGNLRLSKETKESLEKESERLKIRMEEQHRKESDLTARDALQEERERRLDEKEKRLTTRATAVIQERERVKLAHARLKDQENMLQGTQDEVAMDIAELREEQKTIRSLDSIRVEFEALLHNQKRYHRSELDGSKGEEIFISSSHAKRTSSALTPKDTMQKRRKSQGDFVRRIRQLQPPTRPTQFNTGSHTAADISTKSPSASLHDLPPLQDLPALANSATNIHSKLDGLTGPYNKRSRSWREETVLCISVVIAGSR
ncbi:Golgin sub A member 6-like protein [Xylographa pallens]|nr:Golgin sub A member 6-like protein [Xylographa pallens]